MKSLGSASLLVVGTALLLSGCGGSGNDTLGLKGAPTAETRRAVQSTLGRSAGAMSMAGAANAQMAASAGKGSGFLGNFVRNVGNQLTSGSRPRRESDTPVTWPDDQFYFDEWLGLWVDSVWLPTEYRSDFYEDEGKAKPAGFMRSAWSGDHDRYPIEWTSDFRIDAGPMSGSNGSYSAKMDDDSSGRMRYDAKWDGSRSEGESQWSPAGYRWLNRSDEADGAWSKDRGEFTSDGAGTTQSENSLGFKNLFRWLNTGAGNGTIDGPQPGLPAHLVWDAAGKGTITYADGTVEEFNWWGTVSSGGGTSGSGSGASGGSSGP